MIQIEDVLRIHEVLIDQFGGSKGIRDIGLLKAALYRPFQTFENTELYPSPIEKSAALIESIVINHPFIDGNKRVGYTLMRLLLLENGYDISASQEEKYLFVIGIASGNYKAEQIRQWIKSKLVST
jgi:death on curing protein